MATPKNQFDVICVRFWFHLFTFHLFQDPYPSHPIPSHSPYPWWTSAWSPHPTACCQHSRAGCEPASAIEITVGKSCTANISHLWLCRIDACPSFFSFFSVLFFSFLFFFLSFFSFLFCFSFFISFIFCFSFFLYFLFLFIYFFLCLSVSLSLSPSLPLPLSLSSSRRKKC